MKFATHKKEAEDFIIDNCDDLLPSILRPGPVYKHGLTTELKQFYQRRQGNYVDRRTGERLPFFDLGVMGTRLDVLSDIII